MPQGTIKTYDEKTKSGILLDDAKNELSFDAESFAGMGIRTFRLGQRVKYSVDGEGAKARIRRLTILTL